MRYLTRLCLAAAIAIAALAASGAPASAATCDTKNLSHNGNTGTINACGVDVTTTAGATFSGKVGTVALTNNGPNMTYFSRGTVTVKWGDGTPNSTGTVSNGEVTASHKYTSAGTKTIEISVPATRSVYGFPVAVATAVGTGAATVEPGSGPTVTFTNNDVWQTTSPATMAVEAADTDGVKSLSCKIGSGAPTTGNPQTLSTTTQGSQTVTCDAVDANDAASQYTAKLKLDTSAPTLSGSNKTVNATTPAGATVNNLVTASDPQSGVAGSPACTPAGSQFPMGSTTVSCTATNNAGLTSAPKVVTVYVKNASEQLTDLATKLQNAGAKPSLWGVAVASANPQTAPEQRCATLMMFDLLLYVPQNWANNKLPSILTILSISSDISRIKTVAGCGSTGVSLPS